MARTLLKDKERWRTTEIYDSKRVKQDTTGAVTGWMPCPLVHDATGCDLAQSLLDKAGKFLRDGYLPAAVNYTRSAFEVTLKVFCDRFKVPVPFSLEANKVESETYLNAMSQWLKEHWQKEHGEYASFQGLIEHVRMFRKFILNPMSHSLPSTIAKVEVEEAIRAVEALLVLDKPQRSDKADAASLLRLAREILKSAVPTSSEQQQAFGHMRTAFFEALRKFCHKKIVVECGGGDAPSFLWRQIEKKIPL